MATIESKEKVKALAKFLEIKQKEITEGVCFGEEALAYDGAEYLVLTEAEAEDRAREEIEYSLWDFNSDFIIQHCKNYNSMNCYEFESAVESLRHAQEECCENANGLVKALIDDMDEFVEDAIMSYGRGRFISRYDGEEHEQDEFYIYRVD